MSGRGQSPHPQGHQPASLVPVSARSKGTNSLQCGHLKPRRLASAPISSPWKVFLQCGHLMSYFSTPDIRPTVAAGGQLPGQRPDRYARAPAAFRTQRQPDPTLTSWLTKVAEPPSERGQAHADRLRSDPARARDLDRAVVDVQDLDRVDLAQRSFPRTGDEAGPRDEPLVGGVERRVGAVEPAVVEIVRKRTWASPAGVRPGSTLPPQPASSSVAPSANRDHLTPGAMIAHRGDGRLRPVEAPQRERPDRARCQRVHEQERPTSRSPFRRRGRARSRRSRLRS